MGAQMAWFNSAVRVMVVVMNICIHAHLNRCIYTCQGGQSQGRYKVGPERSRWLFASRLFPSSSTFPSLAFDIVEALLLPKIASWLACDTCGAHLLTSFSFPPSPFTSVFLDSEFWQWVSFILVLSVGLTTWSFRYTWEVQAEAVCLLCKWGW